jgi:hypothetical protein
MELRECIVESKCPEGFVWKRPSDLVPGDRVLNRNALKTQYTTIYFVFPQISPEYTCPDGSPGMLCTSITGSQYLYTDFVRVMDAPPVEVPDYWHMEACHNGIAYLMRHGYDEQIVRKLSESPFFDFNGFIHLLTEGLMPYTPESRVASLTVLLQRIAAHSAKIENGAPHEVTSRIALRDYEPVAVQTALLK